MQCPSTATPRSGVARAPSRRRRDRVHTLALAVALSTAATGLLAGPAHAAPSPTPNPSSPSSSSSSSPSSADGAGRKQAPRPPAAADPDDQDAVDSLWQQILHTLGLGDDGSTRGAKDESTDEDPADKDSASTPPASAAQPAATADSTASGQAMPTTAPAGWSQVLADDFTTPTALGTFPGPAYSSRWGGYDGFADTSGVGTYTPDRVVSVSDGVMDLHLHTGDGKALTAAPVPRVDGRWGGWTYGRYSVRFRADAVAGYKTAWLLWPDSGDWNDGEIDFPEGDLDGSISAFVHPPGDPSSNALAVDTGAAFTDWHTATTEWLLDGVTFFLDGEQVGHTDVSPSTPMHLVLQTETSGQPAASAAGHVQIDWITLARRD